MKLKGTNVTGRDRETRKDNGQCARVIFVSWIQRYGCVEFVVGSLTSVSYTHLTLPTKRIV